MLTNIKNRIATHHSVPEGHHRMTSVLLALIEQDGELHIVFEKRSETLTSQPGEVCLPGGKNEDGELPILSALRETSEELMLDESKIHIFGDIDPIVTPFNLIVYPFVGVLDVPSLESIRYNRDEVDHLFSVPLRYFIDNPPTIYTVESEMVFPEDFPFDRIPDGKDYRWKRSAYTIAFYDVPGYTIWGITARIVNNFVGIIKGLSD